MPKFFIAVIAVYLAFSTTSYALDCTEELRQKICFGNTAYCTAPVSPKTQNMIVEIAEESSPLAQKLFCDIYQIRIVKNIRGTQIGDYRDIGKLGAVRIVADHYSRYFEDPSSKFGRYSIGDGQLTIIDASGAPRRLEDKSTEKALLRNLLLHELAHHFEFKFLGDHAYQCSKANYIVPPKRVRKLIDQIRHKVEWTDWMEEDFRAFYDYLLQTDKPTLYGTTNLAEDFAELFEYFHLIHYYGENEVLRYKDESLAVDFAERFRAPIMQNKVRLMEVLMAHPDFDSEDAKQWQRDFERCEGVFSAENLSPLNAASNR